MLDSNRSRLAFEADLKRNFTNLEKHKTFLPILRFLTLFDLKSHCQVSIFIFYIKSSNSPLLFFYNTVLKNEGKFEKAIT